jgi:hypothetical protein
MAIKRWDFQKIGIWLLLPSFIFVAIILPAFVPLGTPAEAFELLISLALAIAFIPTWQQLGTRAYHRQISPRGPPAC